MATKIEKQQTGFKFGKYRLKLIKEYGEVIYNGRKYKLVGVQTNDGSDYLSLRLYNGSGRFIKQLLIEVGLATQIIHLFRKVSALEQNLGKVIY